MFNPIDWLAWVYGRYLKSVHGGKWVGGVFVVLIFAAIGLVIWMRAIDKYDEEHESPKSQAAPRNNPSPQTSAAASQATGVEPTTSQQSHNQQRKQEKKHSRSSYALTATASYGATVTPASVPKPLASSQDNSVHIGKGGKIEQTSKGNCSPNIVGGSNTVNCREPTVQEITVVVGYECQVAMGAKVPESAGYMVASAARVTFRGAPITLALQPVVEVVKDPAKPLTAFVKETFALPSGSIRGQELDALDGISGIDVTMLWPGDSPRDQWCVGSNGAVYLIAVNGNVVIPQTKADHVELPQNGYAKFYSNVSLKSRISAGPQ